MLRVVTSPIMLSVVMLSIIMLSVVILSVVAPSFGILGGFEIFGRILIEF
jgi:hypothetical protein